MARVTRGRTLVRAPKRRMFWTGVTGQATLATGTSTSQSAVSEAEMEGVPNPTLIRVRGSIIMHPQAIGAAEATVVMGVGLIIQDAKAVTAGVSAQPVPVLDIGSDWLYHQLVPLDVQSAITVEDSITQNVRIEVDNKAMRKFDLNQALQFVIENHDLNSTMTVSVTFAFRFLFKA